MYSDSIFGTVKHISNSGLHFYMTDTVLPDLISCYLVTGQENLIAGKLEKQVCVHGTIYRHPTTGQPTDIKDITKIEVIVK